MEQEYSEVLRYLATRPQNKTFISKNLVDYWLLNHSDTFFCWGELRRIVLNPVTDITYSISSELV